MNAAETANLTRFDGRRPGFFEVYFVEVQDAAKETGLWVRYTLRSPVEGAEHAVAELWAMFFDRLDPAKSFAMKRTVPFAKAFVARDRFEYRIDDLGKIDCSGAKGVIEEGGRRISWDLTWPEDRVLVHYPFEQMYTGPLPKTKVISPHFDLRASGSYSAGDRTWTLDKVPGQQSHLWGTQHAHRWMWCHVNTFDQDSTAVFEALSAQVKVGPVTVPPLSMFALRYKGVDHLFNRPAQLVRDNDSRTDTAVRTRAYFPVSRWIVAGESENLRVRGELWADIGSYLGVRYKDPDGSGLVCNHSKVANAKIEILTPERGGWRVIDTLTATGAAALEFVGREADPRVPVRI